MKSGIACGPPSGRRRRRQHSYIPNDWLARCYFVRVTLVDAPVRQELLEASDESIEDAVTYADPMVLRGLLYQLTGDESLPATEAGVTKEGFFGFDLSELANEDEVALIQAKAAAFLKAYRDAGAGELGIGPAE